MLTLFACPKGFVGHFGVIQENAIRAWQHLDDDVEILLLGDDPGVAEAAARLGVRHIAEVERSAEGTPLVNACFHLAEEHARHELICYVDCDNILLDDFADAVRRMKIAAQRPFLMVGRRWDFDLTELLTFEPGWQQALRDRVLAEAELHGEQGMDYFLFPKGALGRLPPFSIGRPSWDKWVLFRARQLGLILVDASPSVLCIHQNHDYSHIGQTRAEVWVGPEARRNRDLAGGEPQQLSLQHATRVLTPRGLVRPMDAWHLLGRAGAAAALHWWLRPLRFPTRVVKRLLHETEEVRRARGWVVDDPRAPTLREELGRSPRKAGR